MCICGDLFTVDHAMVCRHGGLIIQRHNEIRDLEAEMLRMVCTDVETEPVLVLVLVIVIVIVIMTVAMQGGIDGLDSVKTRLSRQAAF